MNCHSQLCTWENYRSADDVKYARLFHFFCRIPFNWKTSFGYLGVFIFIYASLFGSLLCLIPVLCLSCGSDWLLESLANDITNDVNDFNELTKKPNKNRRKKMKNLLERFRTILQDFSDIKELRERFFLKLQKIDICFSKIIFFCCIHFNFRLVYAFNDIIKFSASTAFLWVLLALSCSMISLQFVLVEYSVFFIVNFWDVFLYIFFFLTLCFS